MATAARLLRALTASASLAGWPVRRLSGHLDHGWRVYLVRTVTGEVGPAIDATAGSWAIELNGTESGQITVRKADLARLDRKWFAPWWASVLFTYTHDGVERPIVAGPVTGWPSETKDELALEFAGPRAILARRHAVREGAAASAQAAREAANIAVTAATAAKKTSDAAATTRTAREREARAAAGLARTGGFVYYSNTGPTGSARATDNLWIRTTDDRPHKWSGSAWVVVAGDAPMWAAGEAHAAHDYHVETLAATKAAQAAATKAEAKASSAGYDLTILDRSPGGIGWALVEAAMAKTGGALPIVRGTPAEPGTQDLTLEWWNLANNSVDKRLAELSGGEDGPDLMFRPRWANTARTRIAWALHTGTNANPTIAQERTPDWDTTPARANVASIAVRSSADHLATRVWATGAGEGPGTVIASATANEFIDAGGPALEVVVSDSDEAKGPAISKTARAELAARADMIDQISIGVRADDTKAPLGTWHVGDKANVTLAGWLSVPDGTHALRIIKASGGLDHNITLEFQEDTW